MKKNNKLINEDLRKFRLLSEYDFYVGEEEEIIEPEGDIITEEPPADGEEDLEGGEDLGDEIPAEDGDLEGGEDLGDEIPDGDLEGGEDFGDDLPEPEAMDEPLPEPEPMEDEIEVDVSQLVQSTEEAKASASKASQNVDQLLAKFDELSQSLDKMDGINSKIEDLENELEKRNPTPEEQLEMRSLSSYPYNLKLTDYWSEKEGNYDVMGKENQTEEELTLTQDEVDRDYNAIQVKDSFNESNPFEEEEEEEQIKY